MAQDWTIRPAGPDDVAALSLVGGATFLESFAGMIQGKAIVEHCARQHSGQAYRAYIDKGAQIWIAETQTGAPIGYAMLTAPDLPGAGAGDIELKRIYLLSRFHSGGLGAALMQTAITGSVGFERLVLGAAHDNARANAFYRKHGFTQINERRFDVGGTLYDDVVLARPLNDDEIK